MKKSEDNFYGLAVKSKKTVINTPEKTEITSSYFHRKSVATGKHSGKISDFENAEDFLKKMSKTGEYYYINEK